MAKFLIEKGAEVNAIEDQGDRPIHYAVVSNSPEIVKLLIEHGSEINEHGDLEVPILIAVREGNLEIVKILIEAGADLYPEGHDVLEAAFADNQIEMINYLVTKVNTFKNRLVYTQRGTKYNMQSKTQGKNFCRYKNIDAPPRKSGQIP